MTQAERIRQFALDHYVAPARAEGLHAITIRAGDVHREMNLANAMPAVCSAIGSNKFEQLAHVTPIPANGANVYFQFSLATGPLPMQPAASPPIAPRQTAMPAWVEKRLDLSDAVVLVSCVKSKRARPAPARSLYISAWFCKVRDIVEASGASGLFCPPSTA
jgi:hypothetical protein